MLSRQDAEAVLGRTEVEGIIKDTAEYLSYTSMESAHDALDRLTRRVGLEHMMLLGATNDILYRGCAYKVSEEPYGTIRHGAGRCTSWTLDLKMARSFARSRQWHSRTGVDRRSHVGVVLEAMYPPNKTVVVPPARTAPWFERAVRDLLGRDEAGERRREREVVLQGSVDAFVLERHDLDTAWAQDLNSLL